MRKLLLILALAISLSTRAQKDTAHAGDTTVKDSVKIYALILTDQEYEGLKRIVKEADEKPSDITKIIMFLNSRLRLLPSQNQPEPQKQKGKN